MREPSHVQHGITTGFITIVADAHFLPAFWAYPKTGGLFPGLVLIHEWWGLTAQVRTQARRLAEAGFYVIVPDLFDGQTADTPEQAAELYRQLGDMGVPRVNAALSALDTHDHCNSKIGVIGWHTGGELAYHLALHRTNLRAAVIFYGKPANYLSLMPANETPILAFYGDNDPFTPPQMLATLRATLAHGQVIVYPGASVGFFNDSLSTYQADAANDAWEKMLNFLYEHLEEQADKE